VPPELLEVRHAEEMIVVDDPIDAFTFVGGPAVPPAQSHGGSAEHTPPSAKRTSPETPGKLSRVSEQPTFSSEGLQVQTPTPSSGVHLASMVPLALGAEWPEDDTSIGRVSADGTRRATLGPGGALRFFWRLASLGLDALAEITLDDHTLLRATLLSGELRALEGDVALRVLALLRRRGRASEEPIDEAGARAVLERKIALGDLGRYERDRLLREVREELLVRIVEAPHAEVVLRRLDDTEPGRMLARTRALSRSLRPALVEAARIALPVARVRELLRAAVGAEEGREVALALGSEREAALAAAELPAELVELIVRLEGKRLDDLLDAAPTEPGLAGALFALVAGDALTPTAVEGLQGPAEQTVRAARALIESASALARDADYFSILGVASPSSSLEVERAHAARRQELAALDLGRLGLGALESERDLAIEALDEARDVLASDRLRDVYARAL